MKTRERHDIISAIFPAAVLALMIVALTVDCQGRKSKSGSVIGDDTQSPVTPRDSVIREFFGKATFTGGDYVDAFDSVCYPDNGASGRRTDHYAIEGIFADSIFLNLDEAIQEDEFSLEVKRMCDISAFSEFCSSLHSIRHINEILGHADTSLTGAIFPLDKVIRPSKKALEKAFPDVRLRKSAGALLNLLYRNPDINEGDERMEGLVRDFSSIAYSELPPLDTARLNRAISNEEKYYDKSAFIQQEDIKRFQDARAYYDTAAVQMKDPVEEIVRSLSDRMDFDTKCVYAIELSSILKFQSGGCVDILGAIIESREYSRYLLEVYEDWRAAMQGENFGYSNYSITPEAYFLMVRNFCVNTTLRHIQKNPEDDDARLRLLRLIYSGSIERDGPYGDSTR